MTAAFWTQLLTAGLLAVLGAFAMPGASTVPAVPLPVMPAAELLLALAAWLAVTAFGVRRGSRTAYRLALAGLALPLLAVPAGMLLLGTTEETFAVWSYGTDARTLLVRMMLISLVRDAAAVTALVLAVATAAMLTTRAARRFFAG